jgi:hypothetical protein
MIAFPSTQTTLRAYGYRPYDDQWHGSHWEEAGQHEDMPTLSEVLRGLFSRRRPRQGLVA